MRAWVPLALAVGILPIALYFFHLLSTSMPRRLAQRTVDQRLRDLGGSIEATVDLSGSLIKQQHAGLVPGLDRLVSRVERGTDLAGWIQQSGAKVSVSGFLLTSVGLGVLLGLAALLFTTAFWGPMVGFGIGASLPAVVLRQKRKKRLGAFEEQFPEALDLISRAVRAGHAFSAGMKMVADEVADPVGPEFRKTFDEQNFGLSLKDAMNNLAARVPSLDVRFFVTAVLIQRETGGNLAEILDNLAHVVRERFKILRQVRVYTAHGRFTGYVLLGLPAALSIVLMFINPEHMNLLFKERMGQMMLVATIVLQTIGYLWIRKVIKIEV
jgi:tight adherence protein B